MSGDIAVRKLVGGLLLLAAVVLAVGSADAQALAATLAPLGFATEVVTDAGRAAAEVALEGSGHRALLFRRPRGADGRREPVADGGLRRDEP
jgi:hypothetical protein